MDRPATGLMAASIWAATLSAQTAPPVVNPLTEAALRELVTKCSQGETAFCSIPLREVPVATFVEQMPVLQMRAGDVSKMDKMPSVKLPAPPCQEDKR
jgi:hypothetical protein